MSKFLTEQENFWAGNFGDQYIERNIGNKLLASNINFFVKALNAISPIKDCIEFGSNVGMNLKALSFIYPQMKQSAIEINEKAIVELRRLMPETNIYNQSILDFKSDKKWDLVLIKGVLIHINPSQLDKVYENLINATGKYLLVCEYYNPSPISLTYRGNKDKLYKRDFAGELLDRYDSIKLIDYGFCYHKDNKFPQDDINWFLMEKTSL